MPPYRVELVCRPFLDDLQRLLKRHPDLRALVSRKLEHIQRNPVELGRRLQRAPLCFKVRVGSDFRLVYHLRGFEIIPVLIYAKNEQEDVVLKDLLRAIDSVIRRAGGDD